MKLNCKKKVTNELLKILSIVSYNVWAYYWYSSNNVTVKVFISWGYPRFEPFFDVVIWAKPLISQPICHRQEQILIRRSNIWRIRWEWLRPQRFVSAVRSGSLSFLWMKAPCQGERTTANSRHTTLRAQPFSRTYCCWRCVRNVRVSNLDTLFQVSFNGFGNVRPSVVML